MNKIAVIYDDIFLEHDQPGHPENAQRLKYLVKHLKESHVGQHIDWFEPDYATEEELLLIHSKEMIDKVKNLSESGGGMIDPDTYVSRGSFDAALAAAGAGKTALRLVYEEGYSVVFVAARPPGHHARSDRSMGFCLFNNIFICCHNFLFF